MSRIAAQADMNAKDLLKCATDSIAIMVVCHQVAWDIQNSNDNKETVVHLADAIQQLTGLAAELLEPVHEALVVHEGVRNQ